MPGWASGQGLLDALGDGFAEDKPSTAAPPEPASREPSRSLPNPPVETLVPMPDLAKLDARIEELGKITRDSVRPVSGLAEAQGRIALLEDREADLERRAAGRWAAAESEVNAGIAELRRRWAPMDEGGKVTAEERAGAIRSILGSGPSAVGTEESYADQCRRLADESVGESGIGTTEESGVPQGGTRLTAFAFDEPMPDMGQRAAPDGIDLLTWCRLQDAYDRDVAAMRAYCLARAQALANEQSALLSPVRKALAAARQYADQLSNRQEEDSEEVRREMAWRLHRTRLDQLRALRDQLTRIADNRQPAPSGEGFAISRNPLNPDQTLIDTARAMDLAGHPGAPEEDRFDTLNPEGLPPLYPPGTRIVKEDDTVSYGNLVKARIAQLESSLGALRQQLADAEANLREEDLEKLRSMWRGELACLRQRGVAHDPKEKGDAKYRVREYHDALEATRQDRAQRLREQIRGEIGQITARLAAQRERLTDIREADAPDPQ